MKKFLLGTVVVLALVILVLPLTGLFKNVLWRMEPAPLFKNGHNLAQELGFPKDAKLLVVNSDDTAGNPTFTHGILDVMPKGVVKSNSVIVHDRNDAQLARVARIAHQHPDWGFGVHLSLTNEYQLRYPWSPVLPKEQVPSLYNAKGLAWEKISEVMQFVNPEEVKKEFIAQIQKAMDAGIKVDHIDSHMGTYYVQSAFNKNQSNVKSNSSALLEAAIFAANHFKLPMTVNTFDRSAQKSIQLLDSMNIIRPDTFFGFYELEEMNNHLSYSGPDFIKFVTAWVVRHAFGFELPYENTPHHMEDVKVRMEIYQQALLNIAGPGLNHFFMHAASEQADDVVIPSGNNHPEGVDKIVRQGDTSVWSSEQMKNFLREHDFIVINYSDILKIQRKWQRP